MKDIEPENRAFVNYILSGIQLRESLPEIVTIVIPQNKEKELYSLIMDNFACEINVDSRTVNIKSDDDSQDIVLCD
jgi:hypothetical protein